MPKMTPKQERFVEAYVATGNATGAARAAGYSGDDDTLASIGHQNLGKPYIGELIRARRAQRLGEAHCNQRRIFGILASQMRADVSQFFDDNDAFIGWAAVRERRLGTLIKSIHFRTHFSTDEAGAPVRVEVIRLDLHSAQGAADKLAGLLDMKRPAPAFPIDADRAELSSRIKQHYTFFLGLSNQLESQYGTGLTPEQIADTVISGFDEKLRDVVTREVSLYEGQIDPDAVESDS